MSLSPVVDRAEKRRSEEDSEAFERDNRKIGEGANKSVHRSTRDYTVQFVLHDESTPDPMEQAEFLEGVSQLPWYEVEETESDQHFDRSFVRMEEGDMSHEEAANRLGVKEVVERDIQAFSELLEQGVRYMDFKPDNLCYFEEEGFYDARPIDLFGKAAWDYAEESVNTQKVQRAFELYIEGTPFDDGIAEKYDLGTDQAENYVIQSLADEPEDIIEHPYKDFRDAVREAF